MKRVADAASYGGYGGLYSVFGGRIGVVGGRLRGLAYQKHAAGARLMAGEIAFILAPPPQSASLMR